jgi:chromosome partitioning protein
MIDGRTVMELACNPRSSEEIAQLWDYLADRLARTARPVPAQAAGAGVVARPGSAVYAGPRSESA